MNGKILYTPKGAAREYAGIGCNFFNGCSNGCAYCYLRRGVLSSVMGGDRPTLKSGFVTDGDSTAEFKAYARFIKELDSHTDEVKAAGGIFMSFSTDPCLKETIGLTIAASLYALSKDVPVTILTKMGNWAISDNPHVRMFLHYAADRARLVTFGFTLTGCDHLEPGADSNHTRILAMQALHSLGYRTFASIEPVIEVGSSMKMILESLPYCDEYRIGLRSGTTDQPSKETLDAFVADVKEVCVGKKLVWKESVRKVVEVV